MEYPTDIAYVRECLARGVERLKGTKEQAEQEGKAHAARAPGTPGVEFAAQAGVYSARVDLALSDLEYAAKELAAFAEQQRVRDAQQKALTDQLFSELAEARAGR